MKCHKCTTFACYKGKGCKKISEKEFKELYKDDLKLLKISSEIERDFYLKAPRIKEAIIFCKKMGFKKIGFAFCIGLKEETKKIIELFEKENFECFSVCCKVGEFDKSHLNLKKLKENNFEAICNPALQAKILSDLKVDIAFLIGLCMGHDVIFNKHFKGYTSTLIVKDRLLAHSPILAIYNPYMYNKVLLEEYSGK